MQINQINSFPQANFQSNFKKQNMNTPEVSFQGGLKKAFVPAAMAIASLVPTAIMAQNYDGNTVSDINTNNVVLPNDSMGIYFKEHGFTQEQREKIADATIEYADKNWKSKQDDAGEAYRKVKAFTYYEDSPANPLALNLEHFQGKINDTAKELTEFRQFCITRGIIKSDHYIQNPTIVPAKDCEDKIKEILGEDITYEQFFKENADIIAKLDSNRELKPIDLETMLPKEKEVFYKVKLLLATQLQYVFEKAGEYQTEFDEAMQARADEYVNDMDKLEAFKNETNPLENTLVTPTLDGSAVIVDLEDFLTNEKFTQMVMEVYRDIIVATRVNELSAKREQNTGFVDLSGRKTNPTAGKPLIYNGKVITIK